MILSFIGFFFDFEGLKLDYFVRNRSFGNFVLNNRHSNFKSMCFTVHFGKKSSEELKEYSSKKKGIKINTELDLNYPKINGFSHPLLPIIKDSSIDSMCWGLIPSFAKEENYKDLQKMTLNSRGETIFEKPSFKNSIKNKRGILVLDGFYEWRHFNKIKYPYYIFPKNDSVFYLGCIYNSWVSKESGEIIDSFSIITTPANILMEKIHNTKKRMPLILDKRDIENWINPKEDIEKVKNLLNAYKEGDMDAFTVNFSSIEKNQSFNSGEIIKEFIYPEIELLDSIS